MDRAVALLTKRVRALGPKRRTGLRDHSPAGSRELGADVFTLMARRAVWEWLGDRCGECHGAIVGEIQDATHPLGGRLFCCIACGGTGRRRYPDAERAGALRLPVEVYRRNWARQFAAVLAMLDRFDGDTERRVRQQLAPVAQSKNVA
ncbi:hypothetical protein [Cupriavidus sp. WS]|uniref:hypothetical protein n=1 Tax=Cupriavidus sp. WS TaxID=1312922 RepID=UPI001E61AE91|nr:hypothetical protein [Cupriavidus sp. WS]